MQALSVDGIMTSLTTPQTTAADDLPALLAAKRHRLNAPPAIIARFQGEIQALRDAYRAACIARNDFWNSQAKPNRNFCCDWSPDGDVARTSLQMMAATPEKEDIIRHLQAEENRLTAELEQYSLPAKGL